MKSNFAKAFFGHVFTITCLLLAVGRGAAAGSLAPVSVGASSSTQSANTPSAIQPEETVATVVFIGDSLTEGYGVRKEEAYPEIVGQLLNSRRPVVKIVNGGISGSVSADADRRLKWFLKFKPRIVVLALGANDALKGTAPEVIKKNLAAVIDLAKANQVRVLLVGIKVFSNFGDDYNRSLDRMYRELAREKHVALMPFLLDGVALDKNLNQLDGKHPNAKGHAVVAKNVARELEKLL